MLLNWQRVSKVNVWATLLDSLALCSKVATMVNGKVKGCSTVWLRMGKEGSMEG